ncbi:hypothetical protein CYLTODRAFT_415983, partial [Cylindrobasidium torrendii FP15055 ss-10]
AVRVALSFEARSNTILSRPSAFVGGPLSLERLILHIYSSILPRVAAVRRLSVRGMKSGWRLHDGGVVERKLTCLYGLPQLASSPTVYAGTRTVHLGVTDDRLQDLLPMLPYDHSGHLVVTIDVSRGQSTGYFEPLWRALHRITGGVSLRVIYMLRDRTQEEERDEVAAKIYYHFRRSNLIRGERLCSGAKIEIHRE